MVRCRVTMLMQLSRDRGKKDPINHFYDIVRPVKRDVTRVREFKSSCYRMRSVFMHLPPSAGRGAAILRSF